jgi:hypothetical protein
LRVVAIRLYENVIPKFMNIEGWSKEINFNIRIKQGCPLSSTHFGIYIDKLEEYLEEVRCVGTTLVGMVIIFLCIKNIVLMARCPFDLNKK